MLSEFMNPECWRINSEDCFAEHVGMDAVISLADFYRGGLPESLEEWADKRSGQPEVVLIELGFDESRLSDTELAQFNSEQGKDNLTQLFHYLGSMFLDVRAEQAALLELKQEQEQEQGRRFGLVAETQGAMQEFLDEYARLSGG
jgi:hypothetical protein